MSPGGLAGVARRALGAIGASLGAALAVGALGGAWRFAVDRRGAAVREAALTLPLGVVLSVLLAPLAMGVSQSVASSAASRLWSDGARARRTFSAAIVTPPLVVIWIGITALAGRFFLTAFHNVGLAALAQSTAFAVFTAAVLMGGAVLRWALEHFLPEAYASKRGVLLAAAGGALLAAVLVALGLHSGDVQGRGGILGAFGVLARPELDLSPVYTLVAIAALAVILAVGAGRSFVLACGLLALSAIGGAWALNFSARRFELSPAAPLIEARPSLARVILRALRRRADHDHDGAAGAWGGGDCDDHDARRYPDARDIPGNGIDEDCSGRDAPLPPPPAAPPPPAVAQRVAVETPPEMNLLLITVDTLRWDLHYAGNPREVSTNLDQLAARSVVFDHAYALSSYTGRAVGPLLAGRYPTETVHDDQHFTAYGPANVLLAERLEAAGFHTLGVASHFYFQRRFGLAQGFQTWDLSAEPPAETQETTSTDARVADRAIALLSDPATLAGRFFMWVHFFDPHKQYVRHPEFDAFGDSERARYDGEVAWTDRQIGRLLAALRLHPAGARTIVVVTADHGEAFNEHGMSWHGIELWDELVRVPLILSVPGIAPRHVETPRSQIDLVPTLLELLRVPAPAPGAPDRLSGVSEVPGLLGEPLPPRPIYVELPEGPFNSMRRSVIADGWKLTERGARHFELYHLATDPGERTNLAQSAPADLARMQLLLEQVRGQLSPPPAAAPAR